MTRPGSSDEPVLRADAARNRRAILDAAATLFAAEGTDLSLERVAAEAGVGVGTIYRRFPSIDALRDVVFEEEMTLYADRTQEAADHAAECPWEAFESWVLFVLDHQARNRAFSDALISPRRRTRTFLEQVRRALVASEIMVDRIRAAGVVRPDFDHADLRMMQLAGSGIVNNAGRSAPLASQRFARYMLEAFRAHPGSLLPSPPAEWTRGHDAGDRHGRPATDPAAGTPPTGDPSAP